MASDSSAPFAWARSGREISDIWSCSECKEYDVRTPGDDSAAIEHTVNTGHAVNLIRMSRETIYPLNLRPPR